jgi:phosphoribosylglycinamide formyltransferase-1
MLRLAVLVSGGGSNLQAIIDQIEQNQLPNVKIDVVISNKPGVFALERAKKHGIPAEVLLKKDYPDKESFGEALLAQLDSYKPDLIVLAGCLLIIPEQVIRSYRNRIINIHPSLIPSFCGDGYYGLKVHEAVLARGVKVTGATVHFVDEGCDTGPIILQKAVPVKKGDTPELLQLRIMKEAEWLILPEAIRLISENKIEIKNNLVEIKE